MTMRARRSFRSWKSSARQSTAMISEATEMLKASSRAKPFCRPPRPMTISRRARSFMSITRRQAMRRVSMARRLPCWMWLSIMAASRLLAVVTAWMSPVKCRSISSLGQHLGSAAAGGPALHAEHRAQRGLAQGDDGFDADAVQRHGQADGGGGLAFAGRGGSGGGHQHLAAAAVAPGHAPGQGGFQLGLVGAVKIQLRFLDAEPGGDFLDRQHLVSHAQSLLHAVSPAGPGERAQAPGSRLRPGAQ